LEIHPKEIQNREKKAIFSKAFRKLTLLNSRRLVDPAQKGAQKLEPYLKTSLISIDKIESHRAKITHPNKPHFSINFKDCFLNDTPFQKHGWENSTTLSMSGLKIPLDAY
jgi:hypothetical protein